MSKSNTTPWLRSINGQKSKVWYYTTAEGKQKSLGYKEADKEKAFKKWHELLANEGKAPKGQELTILSLITTFLYIKLKTVGYKYHTALKTTLTNFEKKFKDIEVRLIKSFMLEDWIEDHENWGDGGKKEVKAHLANFFGWLISREIIDKNPASLIRTYKSNARGMECIIPDEDWYKFIQHTKGTFKLMCQLIWYSGSRPSEIRCLQINEVDLHNRIITKVQHKTKHKGKRRSILLTEEATELLRGVIGDRKTGSVFLNRLGRNYSSQGISDRWTRAREKAGLAETMIPYGCRHTFTVNKLRTGVPAHVVAAMLGHTGTAMLYRHYGHILDDIESYRKWL